MQSSISWFDTDSRKLSRFQTGVSIHSHTQCSKESLDFIDHLLEAHPIAGPFLRQQKRKAKRERGIKIDLPKAYWTSPVCPRTAFELEREQIESKLCLQAMISISDHDCIEAPLLLRVVPDARAIPVSLEWTALFGTAQFHLGIHNLPSSRANELFEAMRACTLNPSDQQVLDILGTLHAIPSVLIVFNHPLWNLAAISYAQFKRELDRFLAVANPYLHAFELNGLRSWKENENVIDLSRAWKQVLISGGDRHGFEPNANVNLTNASCFTEWVEEIRRLRISHLLFMPQYRQSMFSRCYRTFVECIGEYPHLPEDRRTWQQRGFHPDRDGVIRPFAELWSGVPPWIETVLALARVPARFHKDLQAPLPSARTLRNQESRVAEQESI